MNGRELTLDQLVNVVDADASFNDLKTYFGVDRPHGTSPAYTGARFESLGGGGDRQDVADAYTCDDLVAVSMLSVRVPGWVALKVLEGDLGRELTVQLKQIPTDVVLGSPGAAGRLGNEQPANIAWRLLRDEGRGSGKVRGIGWVTVGKLLARKRPHLIPVYDGVVKCAVGRPPDFWIWLHDMLRSDEGLLARRLVDVGNAAKIPTGVSALRVLDVVLWMRHHKPHRESGGACRGLEF